MPRVKTEKLAPLTEPEDQEFAEAPSALDRRQEKIDMEETADIAALIEARETLGNSGAWVEVKFRRDKDFAFKVVPIRIPVETFDHLAVMAKYGAGDYIFQFKTAEGKFHRKVEMSSAAEPVLLGGLESKPNLDGKLLDEFVGMVKGRLDHTPAEDKSTQVMAMMLSQMQSNQQAMLVAITEALKAPKQTVNWAGIGALAGAIGPVFVELFKGRTGSVSLKDQVETIKMLKEIAEPSDDKEDSFFGDVLKGFAPLMGAMLGGGQQVRALPPPSAPEGQPAAPAPQSNENMKVTQFMGMLVTAAAKDDDPGVWADMIERFIPPDHMEQLRLALVREDWVDILFGRDAQLVANIKQYPDWFEELRKSLLADADSSANSNAAAPNDKTAG